MSETDSSTKKGGSGRTIGYVIFAIVVLAIVYWGATAYQDRQAEQTAPAVEEAAPEADAATPAPESEPAMADTASEPAMEDSGSEPAMADGESEAMEEPKEEKKKFDSRDEDFNPFTF